MPADYPSRLDLFAIGRQHVLARATRIDPNQIDVQGSDVNIIVSSQSFIGYEVVKQLVQKINALLLDGSRGDDLDRFAFDRYQLPRKGAAAAVGEVRFFRTSIAAGAGDVPVGTKLVTLTGVEYITETQATFGATDASATANVRAVLAGKATQVGANTIRRVDNPSLLFDTSLQVNNDAATSGGEDREEDDVFRERVRDFFNTARRGTLAAIEFGAKDVDGIESAQALETLTPSNLPARVVELFVADGSGVSNTVLGAQVTTNLAEFRCAGIRVITSTSTPQIVAVTLQLTFLAGVDTASLTEEIRASLLAFVNSLGVNQTLLRGDLFAVLRRFASDGLIPLDNTIVAPTGDLVPATGSTLRTTTSDITVS